MKVSPEEQAELVSYATKFGYSVGHRYPRICEDLVSASLHGAAIALASPRLPADAEGRRKFVGQTSWNMIRRELTFQLRKRPVPFTDAGFDPDVGDAGKGAQTWEDAVAWEDERQAIAKDLTPKAARVLDLAYGPKPLSNREVAAEVGIKAPCLQHHLKKIRGVARRRYERRAYVG